MQGKRPSEVRRKPHEASAKALAATAGRALKVDQFSRHYVHTHDNSRQRLAGSGA